MTAFSDSERRLLTLFSSGSSFSFEGDQYEVRFSGKPTAPRGEPKTDIFVRCIKCGNCTPVDFKISYKQEDADFLENKITPERAANIWGRNWSNIIQQLTMGLYDKFNDKKLVFKTSTILKLKLQDKKSLELNLRNNQALPGHPLSQAAPKHP